LNWAELNSSPKAEDWRKRNNINFAYRPKQLGKNESSATLVSDDKYEATTRSFLICNINIPSVKYFYKRST